MREDFGVLFVIALWGSMRVNKLCAALVHVLNKPFPSNPVSSCLSLRLGGH